MRSSATVTRTAALTPFALLLVWTTALPRTASAQLAAVGQQGGPRVTIVDLSVPASPVIRGTVTTSLVGVVAVAVDPSGSRVVAGELNGCRVAIISITNPDAPVQTGILCTPFAGVSSLAVSGTRAVVGEQNGPRVVVLDVSGATPVQVGLPVATGLTGVGSVAASGSCAVAGEFNGNRVRGVNISGGTPAVAGAAVNTPYAGVSSVGLDGVRAVAGQQFGPGVHGLSVSSCAVSLGGNLNVSSMTGVRAVSLTGTRVLVGEENGPDVAVVNLTSVTTPTLVSPPGAMNTGFAGVSSVAANGALGVVGQLFGPQVRAVTGVTGTPALAGNASTSFAGVSSVALTSFSPPRVVVASSLSFSNVNVGSSSTLGLTVSNAGGSTLQLTSIASSSPRFVPATTTLSVGPFATGTLNITFSPTAPGPVSATLTANTNDPSAATINVALSGVGTLPPPAIVVASTLPFGVVRVATSATNALAVQNVGGQTLQLTNIASSSPRFTPASSTLSVGPGVTSPLNVTFIPNAETAFTGTLTANTNDPMNPTISVALSGSGGLPHIAVSSASLNFGSVAVCQSASLTLTISNTGAASLNVSAINLPPGAFTRTPPSLVVPGGSSAAVQVTFTPAAVGPAGDTMTLVNDDPDPAKQNLAIGLSGTGTPTPPPAITLSPTALNYGATLVNFFIGKRITVQNTGPCTILDVNLTSSSAVFPVTSDPNPVAVPPFMTVTQSISPGASQSFVVVFAPTATGTASETLTVASNDPANPSLTVALSGTGVTASASSLSLVLDRSGSMSDAVGGGTKMDALKSSAKLFTDLIIEGQGDRLGTVEFDDLFSVLTPIADVTAAHKTTVKTAIDGLFPRGATSIGGGLQTGLSQLSGATTPRKIVMVFTDGMENAAPSIATVKPTIPAGTEVYSVGLGDPAMISAAALSDLAVSSSGRFFNPQDPLILRKDFVQVLSDAFRMSMAADPIYTIAPRATHTRYVPLSACEHRVSFIVYWQDPASSLGVEVVAPNGMVYTPAAPLTNRLVRYVEGPGYKFYQIAFPPLDVAAGGVIGPPRAGNWVVRVKGDRVAGASERYSLSVIVESDLALAVRAERVQVGQSPTLQARLTEGGKPVRSALVTARVLSPSRSIGQVLSDAHLPGLASPPPASRDALPARAQLVRQLLLSSGRPLGPLIRPRVSSYQLFDDGKHGDGAEGDGVYAVVLPELRVDGGYQVEFRAQAGTCQALPTREATLSFFAPLKVESSGSRVGVTAGIAPGLVTVTVTPASAMGTLLGPGLGTTIKADVSAGGGRVSRVRDNLDGSYSIEVRDARPDAEIQIEIDGVRLTVPLRPSTSKQPSRPPRVERK